MIPSPKANDSNVLSPTVTLVDGRIPQKFSPLRRYLLLLMFCMAQFIDSFNNSALFSAIPTLINTFGMNESTSTWIISAFQLTFASFLLISGRVSDIYNPKYAFIGGLGGLGVISIGAGFVKDSIALIILRALMGICGAMTVPSALTLLVGVFPEPTEQARAIGMFGGSGAVANVLGLIIGAIFIEFANWKWVFWFVALVASPIAFICLLLVPSPDDRVVSQPQISRWKLLDVGGVSFLTAALILFIYAITSGSTDGWASAGVLAPLIISIFMIAGFFFYETLLPVAQAAVPPRTWFLPNFAVLFGTALLPYFWWTTIFTTYTTLWQNVYHWSVISTAIHMIPIGVLSFSVSFSGPLARRFSPKWIIMFGESLLVIATILLVFSDGPETYWPFVFPAFVIGSAGSMFTYTHTNIAIFRTCPPSFAGTVGALFNGALQLGSAIGIAAVGSIESSLQQKDGTSSFAPTRTAFFFLLGVVCLQLTCVTLFYDARAKAPMDQEFERMQAKEKAGVATSEVGALDEEKVVEGKLTFADDNVPSEGAEGDVADIYVVNELTISPV